MDSFSVLLASCMAELSAYKLDCSKQYYAITDMSCLVGGVNRIGDKSRLFSIYPRLISRLDKTASKFSVADGLDLSPFLFTPPTRTREDSIVRVCGVNWA